MMISEDNIKKRISVLDADIQKVSMQLQELDKQKQDAVALMNALNGAKQKFMSFQQDLNNDEPEVSDLDCPVDSFVIETVAPATLTVPLIDEVVSTSEKTGTEINIIDKNRPFK